MSSLRPTVSLPLVFHPLTQQVTKFQIFFLPTSNFNVKYRKYASNNLIIGKKTFLILHINSSSS